MSPFHSSFFNFSHQHKARPIFFVILRMGTPQTLRRTIKDPSAKWCVFVQSNFFAPVSRAVLCLELLTEQTATKDILHEVAY